MQHVIQLITRYYHTQCYICTAHLIVSSTIQRCRIQLLCLSHNTYLEHDSHEKAHSSIQCASISPKASALDGLLIMLSQSSIS